MRTPRANPSWLTVAAVALVLAAAALLSFRLARARDEQAGRLAQLEAQNRQLREASRDLARQLEALRQGTAAPPCEPGAPRPPGAPQPAGVERESPLLTQLRDSLARANSSLAELQTRLESLQADFDKASEQSQRLAASESDLTERLAGATRVIEALQAEVKGNNERLAQLETTSNRLHQESRAASERARRLLQETRELEEINRRREVYLTNILRRYRDITDQYRVLAVRLETPPESAAPAGSELARIQNAIAGAEEDLRQLAALNAQAALLQQKIAAK